MRESSAPSGYRSTDPYVTCQRSGWKVRLCKTGVNAGQPRKNDHPLYPLWKSMAHQGGRTAEWADFWRFVDAVPPRPSPMHNFYRARRNEPWGPANGAWRERVCEPGKRDEAALKRAWRSRNADKFRDQHLRSKFGITEADYLAILESQGGGCAICGLVETSRAMAVDHCHTTKAIRGILCRPCNVSLGAMRDSEELLLKAAEYLRTSRARQEAA